MGGFTGRVGHGIAKVEIKAVGEYDGVVGDAVEANGFIPVGQRLVGMADTQPLPEDLPAGAVAYFRNGLCQIFGSDVGGPSIVLKQADASLKLDRECQQ